MQLVTMKKLIYILSLFTLVLLLDSCNKEEILPCGDHDAFELDSSDDTQNRGPISDPTSGGVVDDDNDDDEEGAHEDQTIIGNRVDEEGL